MKRTLILNCAYWLEIYLLVYLFYFLDAYIIAVGKGNSVLQNISLT